MAKPNNQISSGKRWHSTENQNQTQRTHSMKTKEHYIKTPEGRVYTTDTPQHWKDSVILKRGEGAAAYREQARADLLEYIKPGDTVYCVLRHVARSGMSRRISLFVSQEGRIRNITGTAAVAMDRTLNRDDFSIVAGGCGMDMGFHLVYSLGYCLWPKGTDKPHGTRNGTPDSDGGYALKHEWL